MKKLTICLIAAIGFSIVGSSFADIQSPPRDRYDATRKLSRAIANIMYGAIEIPYTWGRVNEAEGSNVAFSYGLIKGTKRTIVRLGFGAYELVTFPFPTYKASYRHPGRKIWWDLNNGYTEFPDEIGFRSHLDHTRSQRY